MRVLVLFLVCCFAPVLWAGIGLADRAGDGGWLLLQEPLGPGGEGYAAHAGDPGLPLPDGLQWPFTGVGTGAYPVTELWRYRDGEFTRATHVLGTGDEGRRTFQRTLYSVFAVDGHPYVMHFNPFGPRNGEGLTQVARVTPELAAAGGRLPDTAVLLDSEDFLDAPAASPDGRHVVFRAYVRTEGGTFCHLRVYRTSDWTLVAESGVLNAGRPVWIDNDSLAVIWYDGDSLPRPPQRDAGALDIRVAPSHTPVPGRLIRLPLRGNKLTGEVLHEGAYPPDPLSRSLMADPFGLGLLLARAEEEQVVVEMREAAPDGKVIKIGSFERYRGMVAAPTWLRVAGVRDGVMNVDVMHRHGEFDPPIPGLHLPFGTEGEVRELRVPEFSAAEHTALVDLGYGNAALLEAVAMPGYDRNNPQAMPLLAHTLNVLDWPGCFSARNPRLIAHLSGMLRNHRQIARRHDGEIPSTLLAYDVEFSTADGESEKRGRYIELYASQPRGGRGAIRTEDNLSGDWLVQSIYGDARGDRYYMCDDIRDGTMRERPADDGGRAYEDLETQLQARRLLMLTGAAAAPDEGGLRYLGIDVYRDPHTGAVWRTWVYERLGRELPSGERERVLMRFVADLPQDGAGTWEVPHALVRAQMRFALSGRDRISMTDLAFEPGSFVELQDLTGGPEMPRLILPATFRVYEDGVERMVARAVPHEFEHPRALVREGRLRAGYNVPVVNFSTRPFTELTR
jgi:hypothetical protein